MRTELQRTLAERQNVVQGALRANELEVETALASEEREQRLADRAYWEPLKKELGQMWRQS